jgi:pimeloyl-ACP methyl ester carboxylesterase
MERKPLKAIVLLCALLAATTATSAIAETTAEPALPIVFVHGFNGSGQQYETQALRWASNDYPNVVTAIDRTSTLPSVIYPILDQFFDDLMAQTGDSQVYVLGHSAGTAVMNGYLNSSPQRAARVAKYIGIDGATAATCPGAVPCMGVWARGNPARILGPDANAYFPEQGHTEVVGSAESFAAQYAFFTGQAPRTTLVLPEPPGQVLIGGRVLNFPANTGLAGATVQVWELNARTARRKYDVPCAEFAAGADGNWGPASVNGKQSYEIAVIRPEGSQQHFYFEPFIRSNFLIRLNLAPLDSALANAIERSPNHSSASIVRQKEWWGNHPVESDALWIDTQRSGGPGAAALNIINGATAPLAGSTIAIITFDSASDGVSNTDALLPLGPFLSGVDVFYPAADPNDGVITFRHEQRGADKEQVIKARNWPSEGHSMTVTFRNWVQDIDSWDKCVRARPSPCH